VPRERKTASITRRAASSSRAHEAEKKAVAKNGTNVRVDVEQGLRTDIEKTAITA
jgi:hypothetical protein